jgi:EmrB/QacA subfamily drug resistance transporter
MHPSYRTLALIVAAALFMENLDGTIIATALPQIAHDLGVAPLKVNLAITSYLLSLSIFIPVSGWMADRFGARRVFSSAILTFMAGSLACALADSLTTLVLARILQGMGGAMMVPVGRLVILRAVPKNELIKALTYLTIPALLGPVLGPPLGGFLVTYYDWRWIFLINIPVGILGLILSQIFIPPIKAANVARLDGIGFALTGCGLAALVFAFEAMGRSTLSNLTLILIAAAGAGSLLLYARHAQRVPAPIIHLGLLKVATYRLAILGGSLFRIGIGALPVLLPLMLQLGFGLSAFASGLITFASAVGALVMKGATQFVLRRYGFRRVLIVNGVMSGLVMAGYALFDPAMPHAVIFVALLLGGMIRSLQFTALNALSYADIGEPAMSSASTFSAMMQQLSLSLGAGTAALALHVTLSMSGGEVLTAADFQPAYLLVGGIVVASALLFTILPKTAGANVSGNGRQASSIDQGVAEIRESRSR